MRTVFVRGGFDNLRSRHFRFLEEAARLGRLTVTLWSDRAIEQITGSPPKFALDERRYILEAIRHVSRVEVCPDEWAGCPALADPLPDVWAVDETSDTPAKSAFCAGRGIEYAVIPEAGLDCFPASDPAVEIPSTGRRKIIVTGCFDWLHSGHIRFFEEVAGLGELYVGIGHDANLRLLKGDGHPLFPQDERRYMVQSIRHVRAAVITTGHGWMDAEPEIVRLGIDAYAVNDDGDKPEKRAFCAQHGLEYIILHRDPRPGLPRRQSTDLRGY